MTRRVVFLVFDRFQILDLTGPLAAFEVASRFVPGAYALSVVSLEGGAVASSAGLSVAAEPYRAMDCDTLVVSGGDGALRAGQDGRILATVREAASRARRIASVCSGAVILALAGLLDGKRATTHWRRAPALQKYFPNIRVEPDRIFIRDGDTWTSAGITAGIDLALALIEDDVGAEVAAAVAKELVVYHRRPGGQSQFSALLDLAPPEGPCAKALAFARERLHERLDVDRLAEAAGLSPRQFARRFAAETGQTPAKAVERLRVEAARAEVEASRGSIEQIARQTGFGDPERMRRAFVRTLGQPPQAMRRTARL